MNGTEIEVSRLFYPLNAIRDKMCSGLPYGDGSWFVIVKQNKQWFLYKTTGQARQDIKLYKSNDGVNFNHIKTIFTAAQFGGRCIEPWSLLKVGNEWRLYFNVRDIRWYARAHWYGRVATSSDLENWTDTGITYRKANYHVADSIVFWFKDKFYHFFSHGNRFVTSTDGYAFSNETVATGVDNSPDFVITDGEKLVATFCGYNSYHQIRVKESTDVINWADKGIALESKLGDFDSGFMSWVRGVLEPKNGDKVRFWLYYNAGISPSNVSVGRAYVDVEFPAAVR